jgi:hypothetical protein
MSHWQRKLALFGLLTSAALVHAQALPRLDTMTPAVALVPPSVITPAQPPCSRPVEVFDIDDYNGPLNRVVARFSQRIENTTVHLPRRHSDLRPCALSSADKFHMFVESSADPLNYVGAVWDAASAQIDHDDPAFRQGSTGFGKRYAAAVTDNATSDFFGIYLFPSLFGQDPRYYTMRQGPAPVRLGHALAHRFVTRGDSGKLMPNYSEWFGTVSTKALSNVYHPGNPRGFGPTATRVGFSVANDMAWDVLREFWPEVTHKLHLPFRAH